MRGNRLVHYQGKLDTYNNIPWHFTNKTLMACSVQNSYHNHKGLTYLSSCEPPVEALRSGEPVELILRGLSDSTDLGNKFCWPSVN